MYDIAVFIYEDDDLNKYVGSYRADFGAVPRVDDYIKSHIRIKNALNCRVVRVIVMPKINKETTDADVIIKAVQVEDKEIGL